jgi:hypothetical protein
LKTGLEFPHRDEAAWRRDGRNKEQDNFIYAGLELAEAAKG